MLIVRMAPISAKTIKNDRIKKSFKSMLLFLLAPVQPRRPVELCCEHFVLCDSDERAVHLVS